ncbi:MAG TPA: hypothetical protein VFP35_00380 [Candidatus Saccharimonadales bacterium]|nr:hypothetical protein [Candidatus Saccharimonadales bacterium]
MKQARRRFSLAWRRFEEPLGFTIIEALIVIAIAGVIIAVVLLAVGPTHRAQRDDQRKNGAQRTVAALEDYGNQHFNDYSGFSCTQYCKDIDDPDSATGHPVSGSPGVSATAYSGITYVIGANCGTGTDAGKSVDSAQGNKDYAVLYWSEGAKTSNCIGNQGSITVSAPEAGGGGGGGGGGSNWAQDGGTYSSCSPSPDKCLSYSGGAAYTAWSPTQFNYNVTGAVKGTATLEIIYKNTGPLPDTYTYFNVNVFVNGTKILSDQHLPVDSGGNAPGPFVTNVVLPDNPTSLSVQWTNDWCCGTNDQ